MVTSYLRAVRRRWYLIAAALLLALGTLALATHDSFTVVSRVVVPSPASQTISDFQGIAQSLTVARAVEFDLRINGESSARLLQQVAVTREPGSDIYDIAIHDASKTRALRICDAWVSEADALYAKLNTAPAALAYSDAVQQLTTAQQQINSLQQQIVAFEYAHPELVNVPVTSTSGTAVTTGRHSGSDSTVTQTTDHTPGSLQNALYLANLQQQLTSEQAMYTQLAQAIGTTQAQALQSTRQASAQVLDPAAIAPINLPLWTALAALLGLLAGLGLVATWEHFDRSLRSSVPLERAFGAQAVVTIAARPSTRELWHVAPVDWARPALPPASNRDGRWPIATYALAAVAAALPHPMSRPGAHDASVGDSPALIAHNGHSNGHLNDHSNGHHAATSAQPEENASNNLYGDLSDLNGFEHFDPLDEPATDGQTP